MRAAFGTFRSLRRASAAVGLAAVAQHATQQRRKERRVEYDADGALRYALRALPAGSAAAACAAAPSPQVTPAQLVRFAGGMKEYEEEYEV